ncbi:MULTISPECIES: amino acid permease [Comamonas]|uniref:Amino acid permease n=2 Tax=Comamonas thiooxydans TaxID=363952 RepID=A0A0E3BUZ5_9BURK|nr:MULTISPECIES: amino acid permease [Comamonas]KGH06342.1 amino acid permease [Comamonas thiooxydans]KGH20068.1 amino acid permease [Comamonas thiooxydans]KGH29279.1 amino acid permease [Comamonas thiooxydans]GAO71063.1 aromatic amino acid transporter AroP [Comamonas sp. E6]
MHTPSSNGHLERKLKNRHIQLIALGGTIGTGLFLGSAGIIELAGPGVLLGYTIGGLLIFFIMRFLGEMLVEEPSAGSFSYFANRYVGRFAGFLSGWNCVALYVLVGMLELTAVGKFIQFWWPDIPVWVTAAVCFVLINGVNFINVKAYGEFEFWFALIKIVAVVAMIATGIYLLSTTHNPTQTISNLWTQGGFLPNGVKGLFMAFAFIMFAFGGVEMLGFAAAETEEPRKVIPKAINQLMVRVLLFYVGSMAVLLSLTPWTDLVAQLKAGGGTYSSSPFVLVFSGMGEHLAAHMLNFVILTATLSVYNSMVYSSSRLLYGMAQEGNAPKSLAEVNKRGVPVKAIVYPGIVTAFCVVLNYVAPAGVIELLISLITAALVIIWTIIIISHLNYRKLHDAKGTQRSFKAPLFPLTNYICLAAMALVVVVMLLTPGVRASAYAIPVWVLAVYAMYRMVFRQPVRLVQTAV